VEVDQNGGKLNNLAQMEPPKKLLEEVLMFHQPTLEETQEALILVTQEALTQVAQILAAPEALKEN